MKRKVISIVCVILIILIGIAFTVSLIRRNDIETRVDSTEQYVPNHNEAYADTYESNISVDMGAIDVPLENYIWYVPEGSMDYNYEIHQWIAYAIYTYYEGNVPDTFKCNLPDDITHTETNMIFTVSVQGEHITLEILLDTYNYHVVVSVN